MFEEIKTIVAENLGVEEDSITMESSFKDDLKADSLDLFEMVMALEENYGIEIPMQGCNVWNIDTGAAFYGKLTCFDVEDKLFWQSDPLVKLYPNEKGRN